VDALLDAFVRHVAPALPHASLDIVGERRLPAGVTVGTGLAGAAADVRARVRFRSYVDASVLEDLYGRAAAFVFLSEYEGFGLTPLEAMAHGLPPVVLDTTVAREIYGEAAVRLPLDDRLVPSLGAVLLQLLTDDAMRARLAGEAARVLSRYDWSRTAAATLAALEDAAGAR
jgi:alpha-1,3-rhamnosyl/mannosyltransferase